MRGHDSSYAPHWQQNLVNTLDAHLSFIYIVKNVSTAQGRHFRKEQKGTVMWFEEVPASRQRTVDKGVTQHVSA